MRCPYGDMEARNGSASQQLTNAVRCLINHLYDSTALRNKSLTLEERNSLIRSRYAAGETLQSLAREFGLSFQRIYQIVHGKHH